MTLTASSLAISKATFHDWLMKEDGEADEERTQDSVDLDRAPHISPVNLENLL